MTLLITIINIFLSAVLSLTLELLFSCDGNQIFPVAYMIVWVYAYNKVCSNDFDKFTLSFWQLCFFISMFC